MTVMKKKQNIFYCFSPPIMIATFLIEMIFAIYLLLFRKMSIILRLSVLLLTCLAIFQLAEYGICESFVLGGNIWARVGFVAITMLPPLGLHLVFVIANKEPKRLVPAAYGAAAIWIAVFLFGDIMTGSVCEGNYVIFHIPEPFEGIYYVYYNVLILAAMAFAYAFSLHIKAKITRHALYWLIFGYAAFVIPSMAFTMIDDYVGVDSPLPSVMCGFAVIFATVLSLKVVPKLTTKKK